MTDDEKILILKGHPLFQDLDQAALEFIAHHVHAKTYAPHSLLITQGDIADTVYFIYKGLVRVYLINSEGKNIPVIVTGEKDFVGDLGAVDNGPVPATVETIQETSVLIATKDDFLLFLRKYSQFAI